MTKQTHAVIFNSIFKKREREPFKIHVNVAAMTVALSSPTPTPFSKAWAASVPVILLAKALVKKYLRIKAY